MKSMSSMLCTNPMPVFGYVVNPEESRFRMKPSQSSSMIKLQRNCSVPEELIPVYLHNIEVLLAHRNGAPPGAA